MLKVKTLQKGQQEAMINGEVVSRICSNCNSLKPLQDFGNSKLGKYGKRSDCKLCCAIKRKVRQQANPEYYRLQNRKYYDMSLERRRKWYCENKERLSKKRRQRFIENKDYELARNRQHYRNNKVYYFDKSYRRRLELRNRSDYSITPKNIDLLLISQDNKCAYCMVDIEHNYSIDHIEPISKGGRHTIMNIQLTCLSCNLRKRDKPDIEFKKLMSISK